MPGTLKLVKDWGFEDVEGGGLPGKTAAEFKALLGQYGLRMQSMLTGYETLRDKLPSVVKDAKDMGCSYVGTAWIPHQGPFTRQHVDQAATDFAPGERHSPAKACSSSTTCMATSSARRPMARCSTR